MVSKNCLKGKNRFWSLLVCPCWIISKLEGGKKNIHQKPAQDLSWSFTVVLFKDKWCSWVTHDQMCMTSPLMPRIPQLSRNTELQIPTEGIRFYGSATQIPHFHYKNLHPRSILQPAMFVNWSGKVKIELKKRVTLKIRIGLRVTLQGTNIPPLLKACLSRWFFIIFLRCDMASFPGRVSNCIFLKASLDMQPGYIGG